MKRSSFISSALAAFCAPAVVPALAPARSFLAVLVASEDSSVWTGEGSTVRAAMASLRANLEGATAPFDEYFAEVFEESTAELEGGARSASHWDFSCPESAYQVSILEKLEGGQFA